MGIFIKDIKCQNELLLITVRNNLEKQNKGEIFYSRQYESLIAEYDICQNVLFEMIEYFKNKFMTYSLVVNFCDGEGYQNYKTINIHKRMFFIKVTLFPVLGEYNYYIKVYLVK